MHNGGYNSKITSWCEPRILTCLFSIACATAISMHLFFASTWKTTLALKTIQLDTI